jgi:hypothetical protein
MSTPASPVPYGTPNIEWFMGLRDRTDDGRVMMVNLMRYHERAQYADGTDGGASGKEADDRYAPTEVLADIGARVMLHGDVLDQPHGSPAWDRVGIVDYPSRWEFVKMQKRPDFSAKHEHKAAGMKETIVMACVPRPAADAAGEGRPARLLVQVLRRAEGVDAVPVLDLPVLSHMDVEATVLGDGRAWDEVRIYSAEGTAAGAVDPALLAVPAGAAEAFVLMMHGDINRFR